MSEYSVYWFITGMQISQWILSKAKCVFFQVTYWISSGGIKICKSMWRCFFSIYPHDDKFWKQKGPTLLQIVEISVTAGDNYKYCHSSTHFHDFFPPSFKITRLEIKDSFQSDLKFQWLSAKVHVQHAVNNFPNCTIFLLTNTRCHFLAQWANLNYL